MPLGLLQASNSTVTYHNPALEVIQSPIVVVVVIVLIVGVALGIFDRLGWLEGAKKWGAKKREFELPI